MPMPRHGTSSPARSASEGGPRWRFGLVISFVAALGLIALAAGVWWLTTGAKQGVSTPTRMPRVLWTFEPSQRGAIISSPVVSDDWVHVAAIRDAGFSPSGAVYGLDRDTGQVLWQFDNAGTMLHTYSTPFVADDRLWVGEGMHANFTCKLYCLEAISGRKCWQFVAEGHIESSPCVVEGRVYFGAGDDGLYCLDAADGRRLWHFRGPYHIDSSPAVVGGRVYAGSGVSRKYRTSEVLCLDAQDGKVLWRLPVDLPAWGSPCADADDVFVGLGNGRLMRGPDSPEQPAGALLCLDRHSGRLRWRHDADDAVFIRPAVDRRHVWLGCRDGTCRCLDRADGRLLWCRNLGSPVVTTPALGDGSVFVVPSGGQVSRLDARTGQVEWTFDIAAHSHSRPRLYSSPVWIPGPKGRLYFGAELQGAVSSAAMLYCLED